MGDENIIRALREQIRDLETQRNALIDERARRLGHARIEIDLVLDSLGYLTASPDLQPDKFDPDGELRRMTRQLADLRKTLEEQEEDAA
jgi:hypothetical protein